MQGAVAAVADEVTFPVREGSVAVLAPVLNRPQNAQPLADSLASSGAGDFALFFLVSRGDQAELDAAMRTGHPAILCERHVHGDWARKINLGARLAAARGYEWILLGADDLRFHHGWMQAALAVHAETGACVVGTNDLGNPTVMSGRHSTHPLVHRGYLECGTADEPDKLVHEGYRHNWVDVELVETAEWRGEFAFARDAVVEHLHPFWRKGADDATYELGRAGYNDDARLLAQRRRLWT